MELSLPFSLRGASRHIYSALPSPHPGPCQTEGISCQGWGQVGHVVSGSGIMWLRTYPRMLAGSRTFPWAETPSFLHMFHGPLICNLQNTSSKIKSLSIRRLWPHSINLHAQCPSKNGELCDHTPKMSIVKTDQNGTSRLHITLGIQWSSLLVLYKNLQNLTLDYFSRFISTWHTHGSYTL
jgi:hypothetical protein